MQRIFSPPPRRPPFECFPSVSRRDAELKILCIMSDYGSCRISSLNEGEEQIFSLPIRHNQERQSDAKKAKTSSQGLNRAVLVSGGATLPRAFSFIARSACR